MDETGELNGLYIEDALGWLPDEDDIILAFTFLDRLEKLKYDDNKNMLEYLLTETKLKAR